MLYPCFALLVLLCEAHEAHAQDIDGAKCSLQQSCDTEEEDRTDESVVSLIQSSLSAVRTSHDQMNMLEDREAPGRISIVRGVFMLGETEVVLLGGNYVMKAQPYFPDADVVQKDAKAMADGARMSKYEHPTKRVLPCVRLGAMFEGAMPVKGQGIDSTWAKRLDDAVEAFASEGIYVFLDIHQDALSTTNGGEGLPWWIAAEMQKTSSNGEPYITSPAHPFKLMIPSWLTSIIGILDDHFPHIETVSGNPWHAYAVGENAGNPAFMNVGNVNMRENNNDLAWEKNTITWSLQAQNLAHRFFKSPFSTTDKKAFFDPFMSFVTHLCRVWEKHTNVVAVELFNEPPMNGLPDAGRFLNARRDLFNFYGEVLTTLDKTVPPIKAPIALEDIGGAVPKSGVLMNLIDTIALDKRPLEQIAKWAKKGQLVLSFHYYQNALTQVSFAGLVALARNYANEIGGGAGVPVFLSEFWNQTAQGTAEYLAKAAELGCNAVTFWQYVNTAYTGTDGWFKYPDAITNIGDPIGHKGKINWKAWKLYEETVANGTFWGAPITGGRGGQMGVFELLPELHPKKKRFDWKFTIILSVSIAASTGFAMTAWLCFASRSTPES
jgi:hypothetical protein